MRKNVNTLLKEAHEKKVITDDEKEAMECGEEQGVGKFYTLCEVYQPHQAPNCPLERPIISCSGSITENIGRFVDHHIKPLADTHPSYLQDTPHYLREIEDLNDAGVLKSSDTLVTVDITSLYTNIPQNEGLESVQEALKERSNKSY